MRRFFSRPSNGSGLPKTFYKQLEGEYSSPKFGPVFPSSQVYVRDRCILLVLNVLCMFSASRGRMETGGLKEKKETLSATSLCQDLQAVQEVQAWL